MAAPGRKKVTKVGKPGSGRVKASWEGKRPRKQAKSKSNSDGEDDADLEQVEHESDEVNDEVFEGNAIVADIGNVFADGDDNLEAFLSVRSKVPSVRKKYACTKCGGVDHTSPVCPVGDSSYMLHNLHVLPGQFENTAKGKRLLLCNFEDEQLDLEATVLLSRFELASSWVSVSKEIVVRRNTLISQFFQRPPVIQVVGKVVELRKTKQLHSAELSPAVTAAIMSELSRATFAKGERTRQVDCVARIVAACPSADTKNRKGFIVVVCFFTYMFFTHMMFF